jgi:hypothetical protein
VRPGPGSSRWVAALMSTSAASGARVGRPACAVRPRARRAA